MITSRDNDLIKLVSKLMTSAKARRENCLFAAEGVRLCRDALLSGAAVDTFIYTPRAAEKYPDDFRALCSSAERSVEVSNELFAKIADTGAPQGFMCIIRHDRSSHEFLPEPGRKYIALENIQDPSNLGTILRTAEALGTDGVILSADCCDIVSPKVVRGSMGAVFRLPYMTVPAFPESIHEWIRMGLACYASTPRDAQDIRTVDFSQGGIILIGNEGGGLRPETIEACSRRVRIEMRGRAESLNAAAAAAILMYEMFR